MHIYSGGFDQCIKRWNIQTVECVATYHGGHVDRIRGLCLNRNGALLVSAGKDGRVCFGDARNGELRATLHHAARRRRPPPVEPRVDLD